MTPHSDSPAIEAVTENTLALLTDVRELLNRCVKTIIGLCERWQEDDSCTNARCREDLAEIYTLGKQLQELISEVLDPDSITAHPEIDAPSYGQLFRNALLMPTCAILGYSENLLDNMVEQMPANMVEDLHRIAQATRQLVSVAEHLAQSGGVISLDDLGIAESLFQATPRLPFTYRESAAAFKRLMTGEQYTGRLLILETNETERDLLARRLTRLGYNVTIATDGASALQIIANESFDMVLMETSLPVLSGMRVLECIRSMYSMTALPIIMLALPDDSPQIVKALEKGANDYISKPCALLTIIARVRSQIMQKRMFVELEESNRKLESTVFFDSATGIPNRRHFDFTLQREWYIALRDSRPVSLLMISIDLFTRFNNLYGVDAGQYVLKTIAQTLKSQLQRGSDLVARYDGEQFAVLLYDTHSEGSKLLAKRIKTAVDALLFVHAEAPEKRLTISMGLVSLTPTRDNNQTDLVETAFAMLTDAQEVGGNTVCFPGM